MKRNIAYLIFILFAIVATSCLKIVEFEEKDIKPMLVVNCFLSPDSVPSVDLTYTVSAIEDKEYFESVKNAKITFKQGETSFPDFTYITEIDSIVKWNNMGVQTSTKFESGKYKNGGVKIESGKKYNIQIEAEGFETVNAETEIPEIIKIDKIDTFSTTRSDQYSTSVDRNAKIYFTDPSDQMNFYRVKTEIASLSFTPMTKDSFMIYPNYSSGYINSTDPVFGTDDTEDIFGGSSYNRFSIFDDKLFDGKQYGLSVILNSEYKYSDGNISNYSFNIYRIELSSISEAMYLYLNSVGKQSNSGFALFTEPVLIYSNVDKGAGIFAGSSSDVYYIVTHNLPNELLSKLPLFMGEKNLHNYIKKLYSQYIRNYQEIKL
ncbi:MAG: DUF4249 domain-containing protein [Prolixibacteraceae bacterium]|nr:DUF4249 domain-containing protein [Prolixibacteraceae bacterium]